MNKRYPLSKKRKETKPMKKWQYLFLLLLICSMFAGCKSSDNAPLSAELKEEMNAAWLKKEGRNLHWDGESGYYGTYRGAVVFLYEGEMAAAVITEKTVAGEEFVWPNGFTIHVYKDSEFYDVEDAYDAGLLTQKNIQSIAKRHDEYLSERTNWGDWRP